MAYIIQIDVLASTKISCTAVPNSLTVHLFHDRIPPLLVIDTFCTRLHSISYRLFPASSHTRIINAFL